MAQDEEKARVESLKKHAAQQRGAEEARRARRDEQAKRESNLIVHGPAKT